MCLGGGSGGSTATQEFKPPAWVTDYGALNGGAGGPFQGYVQQGINLTSQPFQAYTGQTVADLTGAQRSAMDMAVQLGQNGSPDLNAARGQLTDTSSGAYLNANPWTGNNSTLGQTAAGNAINSNPYVAMGGAYTNAVQQQQANQLAQSYRLGTGAQTDAAFARGGAYGGSAYDQMVAANQAGLGTSIGNMLNQYGLAQSQMGSQDYQNERGLQQQAALAGNQAYQTERGNQMTAAGMAPGYQQADLAAIQAMAGAGDAQRQYTQDLLNQGQAAWNQQQQYPYQQLDAMGNVLARASGNAAGGSTQTASQMYQASPIASLLGLGAAGYGLYGLGN